MLDPSMTINQLESGATAKDVFPLDARAGMLERKAIFMSIKVNMV